MSDFAGGHAADVVKEGADHNVLWPPIVSKDLIMMGVVPNRGWRRACDAISPQPKFKIIFPSNTSYLFLSMHIAVCYFWAYLDLITQQLQLR